MKRLKNFLGEKPKNKNHEGLRLRPFGVEDQKNKIMRVFVQTEHYHTKWITKIQRNSHLLDGKQVQTASIFGRKESM